jgi:hypothetical protein
VQNIPTSGECYGLYRNYLTNYLTNVCYHVGHMLKPYRIDGVGLNVEAHATSIDTTNTESALQGLLQLVNEAWKLKHKSYE